MKIKVELTESEAKELLLVAGNGWGDGDYYGIDEETGKGQGYGDKKQVAAFLSAYAKIASKVKMNPQP